MNDYAPVVVFACHRPTHLKQTLDALAANRFACDTDVTVRIDGPPREIDRQGFEESVSVARQAGGFKSLEVIVSERNRGLSQSIITGVDAMLQKSNSVIVLEDDLVTSQYFLDYMNAGLKAYEQRLDIFAINGFNHPPDLLKIPRSYTEDVFLNLRPMSWGWATWRRAWSVTDWSVNDYAGFAGNRQQLKAFNRGGSDLSAMLDAYINGTIDSWAVRWSYALFRHGAYALSPRFSYVRNIGHDGSGRHCGQSRLYDVDLNRAIAQPRLSTGLEPDQRVLAAFRKVYAPFCMRRLMRKLRLGLWA